MIIYNTEHPSVEKNIYFNEENNRLEVQINDIMRYSTPQEIPLQFYVLEETTEGDLEIDGTLFTISSAQYHHFTTDLENKFIVEDKKASLRDLQTTFGSKTAKMIYGKMPEDQKNTVKRPQLQYKYIEQILPPLNMNAQKPTDFYVLSNIINQDLLALLNNVHYEVEDICLELDFLRKYKQKYSGIVLLIDTLYKLLSERRLFLNKLKTYNIKKQICPQIHEFLKPFSSNTILSDLGRDRLSVIYYILVIMITKNKAPIQYFPMFTFSEAKFSHILKTIGCVVTNGIVSIQKKPIYEVEQRKRRLNI